jgi:hypothetical protein
MDQACCQRVARAATPPPTPTSGAHTLLASPSALDRGHGRPVGGLASRLSLTALPMYCKAGIHGTARGDEACVCGVVYVNPESLPASGTEEMVRSPPSACQPCPPHPDDTINTQNTIYHRVLYRSCLHGRLPACYPPLFCRPSVRYSGRASPPSSLCLPATTHYPHR